MYLAQRDVISVAEAVVYGRAQEPPFAGGEKVPVERRCPRPVQTYHPLPFKDVPSEKIAVSPQDSLDDSRIFSLAKTDAVVILTPAGIAAELLVNSSCKLLSAQKALSPVLHILVSCCGQI